MQVQPIRFGTYIAIERSGHGRDTDVAGYIEKAQTNLDREDFVAKTRHPGDPEHVEAFQHGDHFGIVVVDADAPRFKALLDAELVYAHAMPIPGGSTKGLKTTVFNDFKIPDTQFLYELRCVIRVMAKEIRTEPSVAKVIEMLAELGPVLQPHSS